MPSSFGMPLKNLCSALCATEPRSFGSTSASIVRGSSSRSTNHADEQSEKRSSSVTLKLVRSPSELEHERMARARVGRSNARARGRAGAPSRSRARARSASSASAAASAASARSRSRSVGASSSGHVSAESGRRVVARRTSSAREQPHDLVPERARLPRRALVARRLAHEVQAPRRRACTRCRRGSGRARPGPACTSRAPAIARRASSSRNGEACVRRGRLPSSSPSRKTTSKLRVRARSRSSTATRPGSRPSSPRTVVRSSAPTISSAVSVPPSRASPRARREAREPPRTRAGRRARRRPTGGAWSAVRVREHSRGGARSPSSGVAASRSSFTSGTGCRAARASRPRRGRAR